MLEVSLKVDFSTAGYCYLLSIPLKPVPVEPFQYSRLHHTPQLGSVQPAPDQPVLGWSVSLQLALAGLRTIAGSGISIFTEWASRLPMRMEVAFGHLLKLSP